MSNFPRHDVANTHYTPKTAKAQLPLLKIKIRGHSAGTSRQEDDIKPNNTQDESDDTQEQPHTNLKRCHDHESSKDSDVESKTKKSKKGEVTPKWPRSRPRMNSEVMSKDEKAQTQKKHEKEFSVVVYVKVAVPPKLHAGKTHKGDKMVPQAPWRCGPFSMFQRSKWSNFLENIVAVTSIDKENLLPSMTWRMQGKKEQDGLPLQSRDAFKAMHDIFKNKARKEHPVLLVHHPITTSRGNQTDIETLTAPETTRWSEKVNICCCLRLKMWFTTRLPTF